MTFKDALQRDMNVFFNSDEFAEPHNLGGIDVMCIVEEKRNVKNGGRHSEIYDDSLHVSDFQVVVYVKDGLLEVPPIGSMLTLDGTLYYVYGMQNEAGMVSITLGTHGG